MVLNNPVVENWLGKLGALIANQFIFQWFGVASFIFVFVFFTLGYRFLFRVKLVSISKALGYSLFGLIFFSIAIGFIHAFILDTPNFLEGEFGFWTNRLLDAEIGKSGAGALLLFVALTFLIVAYNLDFKLPEKKSKMVTPVAADEIMPQPVQKTTDEIPMTVEMPGRTNKENLENTIKPALPKEKPLEQTPIFHEPIVFNTRP